MADARQGPAVPPLSVKLSIPAAGAFRGIGRSMAAKFATTVGCTEDEAARVEADFAKAADVVSGGAPRSDIASLDIELTQVEAHGLEIRVRCAGGEPAVVRLARRP
jgi:hypothetical protein